MGRRGLGLIAGPTASGKSAVALTMAERLPVTVINADASQVYRDLRILSARPSSDEEARAPHRLFGTLAADVACSAADWAAMARAAIAESHAAGRLPLLVGGTGLYLRTLLDGIAPVPAIPAEIREAVRRLDVNLAYECLQEEDPEAAGRLNAADRNRVARALEVVRATGTPLHRWQEAREGGIGANVALAPLILLPPRDWLVERCTARLDAMFAGGAIAEVEALLALGLSDDLPVMRAIGVPEIAAFLRGEIAQDEARQRALFATRQYAKRQYTWFRNQPPADWPRHEGMLNDEIINHFEIKLRDIALT